MTKIYLTESQRERLLKVFNFDLLWKEVERLAIEDCGIEAGSDLADEVIGSYCYHIEHRVRELFSSMPLSLEQEDVRTIIACLAKKHKEKTI